MKGDTGSAMIWGTLDIGHSDPGYISLSNLHSALTADCLPVTFTHREVSVGGGMLLMFSPFAIFLIILDQVTGCLVMRTKAGWHPTPPQK